MKSRLRMYSKMSGSKLRVVHSLSEYVTDQMASVSTVGP